MKTNPVNCIMCDHITSKQVLTFVEPENDIALVKCINCELVFVDPRFSKEDTESMYESNSLGNAEYYLDESGLEDDKKAFYERLLFAEKFLSHKNVVIDIGASVGTFLHMAKQFEFSKLIGVELNSRSREKAKELFGLDISNKLPDDNIKADLVNMSDLIEHLENPIEYLKNLKKNMQTGSILLISTPDFNRWITKLVNIKPREHLYYFTKNTLTKSLEKADFNVVYIGNITRFRTFKQLVVSGNAKNPMIKLCLKLAIFLRLDGLGEKILFHNLNNDIFCIATPAFKEDQL